MRAAIVALSPSSDNSYLAYPSPVPSPSAPAPTTGASAPAPQSGDVLLFSTRSLTVANVIQAHKQPLALLQLNSTGTLLATASTRGTVIRVWSVPGAEKLYQLRRGTSPTRIQSMAFNAVSSLLAVSSAHDTVHIFKLGPAGAPGGGGSPGSPSGSIESRDGAGAMAGGYEGYMEDKKKGGAGVGSSLRRRSLALSKGLTSAVGSYLPLPGAVSELWEPARDFASLRLPTAGARCMVALSGTLPQVYVVSSEGYFYAYSIDLEKGGECGLVKQYRYVSDLVVMNTATDTLAFVVYWIRETSRRAWGSERCRCGASGVGVFYL
jgi:autophagy-related protein 18